MSHNQILTSVHGRRLGLSASGGLLASQTSSTGVTHFAEISSAGVFNSSITSFGSTIGELTVKSYKSIVETVSSTLASMVNYGLSIVSTGSSNGTVLSLSGAPEAGLIKEIFSDTSASTITIDTTAAGITFQTSMGSASSAIVWDKAGGSRGKSITLMGLSATRWAVMNKYDA